MFVANQDAGLPILRSEWCHPAHLYTTATEVRYITSHLCHTDAHQYTSIRAMFGG